MHKPGSSKNAAFEMPPEWYDEDLIFEYMQEFKRPRHIHPAEYDRKLNFWKNLILHYAEHHHVLYLTEESLIHLFTKTFADGGKESPNCFRTVLADLAQKGQITSEQPTSFTSKVVSSGFNWLVKKPLTWSWSLLTGDNSSESSNDFEEIGKSPFIIPHIIAQCERSFLNHLNDQTALRLTHQMPVLSKKDFDKVLEEYFLQESSRNLMRQHLLDRHLIVEQKVHQAGKTFTVVKFADSDFNTAESPLQALNETEASLVGGIMHLRQAIHTLEHEEKCLTAKITARYEEIKLLMRQNKKDEAKSLLRRTKLVQGALEQKQSQLHNLESMLLQVETASNNRDVISALSAANKTLRSVNVEAEQTITGKAGNGLTLADAVEDTMAEIADSLAQQNELLGTLGGSSGADDLEMMELEDELAFILSEKDTPANRSKEKPSAMDEEFSKLDFSDLVLPDVSMLPSPGKAKQLVADH